MKRLIWLSLASIGASAVLLAAGFWDKKGFLEWSDREVARMMENSPWSREVHIMVMPRATFSQNASGGGFPTGGASSGRGRSGRNGGGLGESELSRPSVLLHVRWLSALPVKQAMVRFSMSSEQELDEQARQFLDRVESHYVITVSGIPNRMLDPEEGVQRFIEGGRIERGKNREPLTPENVEPRPEQNRITLFFFFPRTDPITLEDKNVEFVLKAENLNFKRKFKLQDMMYQGKLEL